MRMMPFEGSCLALSLVCLVGCSEVADDRPATYEVQGVVKHNGEPVPDAQVTFAPKGNQDAAFGRTDSEGHYELTTFEPGDGAVAGKYVVTVTKYEAPPQAPAAATGSDYVPPDPRHRDPKPKNLLPSKYASPATSDLQIEVNSEPMTYDVTLTD